MNPSAKMARLFAELEQLKVLNSKPDLTIATYGVVVVGLLVAQQLLKAKLRAIVKHHSAILEGEGRLPPIGTPQGPSPLIRIALIFFPSVLTFFDDSAVDKASPAAAQRSYPRLNRRVSALLMRPTGPTDGMRSPRMGGAKTVFTPEEEDEKKDRDFAKAVSAAPGTKPQRMSFLQRDDDLNTTFISDMTAIDLLLIVIGPACLFLHFPPTTAHILNTCFRIGLGFRLVAPAAAACHELIEDVMVIVNIDHSDKTASGFTHLSTSVRTILWLFFFILVLRQFGYDTSAMVNGLGLGGVVVGLALQNTMADYFAGLTLLVDRYFNKGDMIVYNGMTAFVREVGLRSTRLEALNSGESIHIPNSKLCSTHIVNHAERKRRRVRKELYLSHNTSAADLRCALDAINAILDRPMISPHIQKYGRAPRWGTHMMGVEKDGFKVEFIYYVCNGQDTPRWKSLETEVNISIMEELQKLGVGLGYPRLESRDFG